MTSESKAEACIHNPARWYVRTVNTQIHQFIKTYDFGFIPELAVNISAGDTSPINNMLLERFKKLRIMKTYGGKVDIRRMPYEDNSIDILITEAVLEHVSQVWEAPVEIRRVLRIGGITIHRVPFMYPMHGEDYFRFTVTGLKDLFREFEVLQVGCAGHREITNFLMKYRSGAPKNDESSAAKKVVDNVGYGSVGDPCSNCIWGCFKKI